MKAWVYQASLLCEDCAHEIMGNKRAFAGIEDSDVYPQGPYANGGGESDCPQHCDHCDVFLKNPLTSDGYVYVRKACAEDRRSGEGSFSEWATFYSVEG